MTEHDSVTDYARVERAIQYLETHRLTQPSLSDVAHHVGLSEHHFQRLFRRWAGVSPKRFVQYLTAEHAKELLRSGSSVLDTTFEAGLSGPGRLHDLMVSVEAMTPGEYKRQGKGLTIRYGFHPTPFGEALVAITDRGVCELAFVDESDRTTALATCRERWALSNLIPDDAATLSTVSQIFDRRPADGPIPLHVRGTNFQLRVWEALLRVPLGTATTYGAIADAIGRPRAFRAVGNAVARNTIGYLIPCHRALRRTGSFDAYRWGRTRKRAILAWESAIHETEARPLR